VPNLKNAFGRAPDSFNAFVEDTLYRRMEEEKPMKKKLSVGLVLAIVLMLITATVLAAVLLSGKDFVQEVLYPKAQENQSLSWTEGEVAEILRIAGENGLSLSEEQQTQLLTGGAYFKEELMRLFVKLDLGREPDTWSIEDQAWYGQMQVDIGLFNETFCTLPEEGEVTESEVLEVLQARIQQQYDPDAPLTDETVYRRHTTYTWTHVNPDDDTALEKRWWVEYEPLDLTHWEYGFVLDTEANILEERASPGIAHSEISPAPEVVQSRYNRLYGKFNDWEMETWAGFQQMLRDAAADHGFGNNEVLALLSLSEFALPQAGEKTKNEAIDMAMAAVMAREGIQESDLQRKKAYGVYLLGEDAPVWKITIPAARDGNYIAEVNAQNGEAQNILLIPLHGSDSIVRSFMLESVYQTHHTEAELHAGTLCFDGRLVSVKPLKNGDFLLFGRAWVDADTTDAWAARVSPNGETLWEVRNEDGLEFKTAVALSDGGFLLAMRTKKDNMYFTLAVITLGANGQMLGDPVILDAKGWSYEGKDYLLVRRDYDTDPPFTLLAVNGKGETLWEHTYDELKRGGGFPWPAADGYIYSGMAQVAPSPLNQTGNLGMMVRLDDQGNLLWKRLMEQYPNTGIRVYFEASDGGMFGAGMNYRRYEDDAQAYEKTGFVVRFDADGNILWCHYYPQLMMPDSDDAMNIAALLPAPDDGALVIAKDSGNMDSLKFIHLDSEGNALSDWRQTLADFPTNFSKAFTIEEQIYLVYHDKAEYGPSNNTYVAPFTWPKNQ